MVGRLLVLQSPPYREIACGNIVTWDSLRRLCFGELVSAQSEENPAGLGCSDSTGPVIYPAVCVLPLSADSLILIALGPK